MTTFVRMLNLFSQFIKCNDAQKKFSYSYYYTFVLLIDIRPIYSKMLKFSKFQYPILRKYFSIFHNVFLAQCLEKRTLLQLRGYEANIYLQGLITNDISLLQEGVSSIFTMFLNSKGRVLYDSIIYNAQKQNTYFIECDKDASSLLKDHLLMYKVRRKIDIDYLESELEIWTIINNQNYIKIKDVFDYKKLLDLIKQNMPNVIVSNDPRLPSLGLRIITPKNFSLRNEFEKIGIQVQEKNFYNIYRYKLGIGEGLQELHFEKCFPMEANGDYLNGICFNKGCYIGQELTARTHHTGVIRKRFMPLLFQEEVKSSEHGIPIFSVSQSNKSIGKLLGVEKTTGLGLLRVEEALQANELTALDIKCQTHRPFWWPIKAFKERFKVG